MNPQGDKPGFVAVDTGVAVSSSRSTRVDPARIERELSDIWDAMAAQKQDGEEAAVTRASMSNVMLYCDGPEQAADAADRIPLLVEQHPARVLVLVKDAGLAPSEIKAWVTAHCRRLHDNTQLCAEHIELRFHPDSIDRAASVVRSLLIGDLPVALWWMSPVPPALAQQDFEPFAHMAHQIIYDSVEWQDPPAAIQAMVRYLPGLDKVVFNLAWRRLKPWRRLLSQSLDPRSLPGALAGLSRIQVRHGAHGLPMAWLLMGWLGTRLGWQVSEGKIGGAADEASTSLIWRFMKPDGKAVELMVDGQATGAAQILDVSLEWVGSGSEDAGKLVFEQQGHWVRCVTGSGDRPIGGVPVPRVVREQMVAAQLAHRTGDPLFEQTGRLVGGMARSLSGGMAGR